MVRVDVKHGHLAEAGQQRLRCDGRVVDVAEARRAVAVGVVAGGTAQRVGHAGAVLPLAHMARRRHRAVRAAQDRAPAVGPERAAEVAQVVARLGDHRIGGTRRTARLAELAVVVWRQVGQDLDAGLEAGARQLLPARVGAGEEVEIGRAVHRLQRRAPAIGRRRQVDAARGKRVLQCRCAGRHVGRRAQPARAHELAGLVQQLIIREEGTHGVDRL
ncbi:hypothetical protein D9M72_334430 [compost metagenome]